MIEGDGNLHALNKHMKEIDYNERQLENFSDDIESHINDIEDIISKIRDIDNGYEHDFSDEWKQRIKDLL